MATYENLAIVVAQGVMDCPIWRKAKWAVLKAAGDIRNEAANTANHANRILWAIATEQDPDSAVTAMKARILQNATIQADPDVATDNDVQFVVNSLIDSFAQG